MMVLGSNRFFYLLQRTMKAGFMSSFFLPEAGALLGLDGVPVLDVERLLPGAACGPTTKVFTGCSTLLYDNKHYLFVVVDKGFLGVLLKYCESCADQSQFKLHQMAVKYDGPAIPTVPHGCSATQLPTGHIMFWYPCALSSLKCVNDSIAYFVSSETPGSFSL